MQKQARIKTSVVTRLEKELAKYHEEHDKQKAKIDGMRASGADEHDIKKQVRSVTAGDGDVANRGQLPRLCHVRCRMAFTLVSPVVMFMQTEVLEETAIMIPDTMRRLNKGVEDLREFIVRRRTPAQRAMCYVHTSASLLGAPFILSIDCVMQTANGGDASLIGSPLLAAAHETLARCGGDGGGADAAADDDAI